MFLNGVNGNFWLSTNCGVLVALAMSSAKPFLFINQNGPMHRDYQSEKVKREVRRHVMLGIGRARRKARRNPRVEVMIRPSISSTNHLGESDSAVHADNKFGPSSFHTQEKAVSPERPFWNQHPLVVLERQWEMDTFSAYGIAFVISEGRHLASRSQ